MNWIAILCAMGIPALVVGGATLFAWRAQRFRHTDEEDGDCGCEGDGCDSCAGEDILIINAEDLDEILVFGDEPEEDFEDLDFEDLDNEVEGFADECEFGNFATPEPEFRVRVVIGSMPDGDSGNSRETDDVQATVLSASDGNVTIDEIEFRHELSLATDANVKIRFLGLDCWEMAQGAAGDLGAEFADHLLEGEEVELQVSGVDRYGRLLTVVPFNYHGQLLDYTALAIRLGRGIRYDGSAFNEGDWTETYDALQAAAKEEGRGVWGFEHVPELPHDFRNGKGKRRKRKRRRTEASSH